MAFPTPPLAARCAKHPEAAAGWRCTQCQSQLCPECVGTRKAGHVDYTVCCLCGGAVDTLRVQRSSMSYLGLLASRAWRYPLGRNGLLSMLGAGVFFWIMPSSGIGALIKIGVFWTYLFTLVRQLSNGVDDIEPPEFTDVFELGTAVLRGVVAMSFVMVPVGVILYKVAMGAAETMPPPAPLAAARSAISPAIPPGVELDDSSGPGADAAPSRHRDPDRLARESAERERAAREARVSAAAARRRLFSSLTPWMLLALLGSLFTPMALLLAATQSPILTILNPVALIAFIRRIPGDYAIALGALLALNLVEGLIALLAGLITLLNIPVLSAVLANSAMFYVPFVTAYVLGSLLWLRGADLGCMREEEGYMLALPDAVPRGTPPPTAEEQAAVSFQRPRAITLDGEVEAVQAPEAPAPRPARASPPAAPAPRQVVLQGERAALFGKPGEIDEPGEAAPSAPSPAERVREALGANRIAEALSLYRAAAFAPAALPGAEHFNVGRAAAAQGDYPLACKALQAAAAANPADPLAPRALVLMGRVLSERMNEPTRAARVFQHIVQHYPDSESARLARERLAAARGSP